MVEQNEEILKQATGARENSEQLLPLLLAKNSVQAIVWNQWTDTHPHEFAHGGLINAVGKAKPALRALTALRRKYLA